MNHCKLFVLALLTIFTACKEPEKPVTKEEATDFAHSLSQSAIKKDRRFLNEAFDLDMLLTRIKTNLPDKPAEFWRGVRNGMSSKMDFGDKIIESLGDKGRYDLIKQYEKEGKQHLLFRIYANYAMNYHDIELVNKKGKTKIADVYVYASGEYLSTSMGNIMGEIDEADPEFKSKINQYKRVIQLMQDEKYVRAKELLEQLPNNLKATKLTGLYNIQICSQINDSLYQDAVDKFQRDFPNDPALDLLLIDAYFVKKKFEEALACIERLDKRINTDPLLDYYRGLSYNLMNEKALAIEAFERLYKNMPDFSSGIFELSTYYMDNGEYARAADLLQKAKTNRDFNESVLTNLYALYPKLSEYLKE